MDAVKIAGALTPLQSAHVTDLARRKVYRTNEGTLGDTILSGLCSGQHVLVKWCVGDRRGWDGSLLYTEQYTLTDLGRAVAAELARAEGKE